MDGKLPLKKSKNMSLRRDHPLVRGLVGAWPIVETSGERIRDFSGNNFHGVYHTTLSGSVRIFDVNTHGSTLLFDGASSYLDCGTLLSTPGEATITAWISPLTVGAATKYIFLNSDSAGNNREFGMVYGSAAAKISITWGNNNIFNGNIPLSLGAWFNVAVVRRGSTGAWTGEIYVNGKLDTTGSTAVNPSAPQNSVIGARGAAAAGVFTGYIEDVRVYNRALTADEIRLTYQDPQAIFCPKRFYVQGFRNPNPTQPVVVTPIFQPFNPRQLRSSDYKKPTKLDLNRSHPLAAGLAAAYPYHEGAGLRIEDFSRNNRGAAIPLISTSASWQTTQRGRALSADASSVTISTVVPPHFKFWTGINWSVFIYANILDTATTAKKIYFSYGSTPLIPGDWYFGQSSSQANTLSFHYVDIDFADDEVLFPANSWPGPGLHSFLLTASCVSLTTIDTLTLYVDGIRVGAVSNVNPGSDTTTENANYNIIGNIPTSTDTSLHQQLVHYVWINKLLNAGNARELHMDPFALLRPRLWGETMMGIPAQPASGAVAAYRTIMGVGY